MLTIDLRSRKRAGIFEFVYASDLIKVLLNNEPGYRFYLLRLEGVNTKIYVETNEKLETLIKRGHWTSVADFAYKLFFEYGVKCPADARKAINQGLLNHRKNGSEKAKADIRKALGV